VGTGNGPLRKAPDKREIASIMRPTLSYRHIIPVTLISCCVALIARAQMGESVPPGYSNTVTGGLHDFDYFAGAWTTKQRALKTRGANGQEWTEFASTVCVAQYLDGVVEVSEMYSPARASAGFTLRAFNLSKRQWAIRFISSRTGEMDSGVFGGFDGPKGVFYGEDVDGGRPIKARNTWTEIDRDHARWEQAFSYDNRNWETNWTADFTRSDVNAICSGGRPRR
jgi:hypothetical protein